jgi:bifunctional UDP-N-acetylglucosamine pyrophosphorylase/glucosamine-1-phosphate N-acetyltransferase
MQSPVTVVILAAGLGTRMKSKLAKVLHCAGGMTLVEQVVQAATAITAPESMVVVTGHQAERVEEVTAHTGVKYALQAEQKGTGHALICCRGTVPESGLLVVLYGDAPLITSATLRELIRRQAASNAAGTVLTAVVDDPYGYGRIIRDADGNVESIVEQKAATAEQAKVREINSGMYCFDAALLWKHIGELGTDNPAHEYYLTDIVEIFRRAGHKMAPMQLPSEEELLGINTRVELAGADRILRNRTVNRLMLEGVTIERPETVTIDAQVRIGCDTVIEPFTRILGSTVIGEDCRIGAYSIIESSRLADGVQVGAYTIIGTSVVDSGAIVGPYARLRLDNHVGAGAHIGNFVELKKTRMGPGAKANHLAYLGDSTIGAKVNIGAGTITCNYDGKHKHQTHIGDGAFVGSNSTLVAPVVVGAGSYIGAASVITKPVPEGALAIGRGHQVNKEGWVKSKQKAG